MIDIIGNIYRTKKVVWTYWSEVISWIQHYWKTIDQKRNRCLRCVWDKAKSALNFCEIGVARVASWKMIIMFSESLAWVKLREAGGRKDWRGSGRWVKLWWGRWSVVTTTTTLLASSKTNERKIDRRLSKLVWMIHTRPGLSQTWFTELISEVLPGLEKSFLFYLKIF